MRSPSRLLLAAVLALAGPLVALPATTADAAVSCVGFQNQTGITNTQIKIANVSDISGPVPGLFTSAQQATKAYVAYFNSTRTICGRKLLLTSYDARTDATANNAAYKKACSTAFAAVGSMSAFDAGGASVAKACYLPDVRARSVSAARNGCGTCFGVDATRAGEGPNSVPDYFVAQKPEAVKKAAFLYINAGSGQQDSLTSMKVAQARGYQVVVNKGIDIADFNYGPYVDQLRSAGARIVHFTGAFQQSARLAQAMQDKAFTPDAFVVNNLAYTPSYASVGGAATNGSITAINFLPLNANQTELNLYRKWLQKVAPGAAPTATGLYAWSAAKLFVQKAAGLGNKLNRGALLSQLRSVNAWTGGGLHVPQQVGTKHVSPCTRLLYLKNGTWVSIGGTAYRCSGVSKVS